MDSGVIRHFKVLLRRRLAREYGGRRQVLEKQLMFDIASPCEVWDSIPEDLRPYMLKTSERWKSIKEANGEWVGWSSSKTKRGRSLMADWQKFLMDIWHVTGI
jgi:hypothetical protein